RGGRGRLLRRGGGLRRLFRRGGVRSFLRRGRLSRAVGWGGVRGRGDRRRGGAGRLARRGSGRLVAVVVAVLFPREGDETGSALLDLALGIALVSAVPFLRCGGLLFGGLSRRGAAHGRRFRRSLILGRLLGWLRGGVILVLVRLLLIRILGGVIRSRVLNLGGLAGLGALLRGGALRLGCLGL